MRPIPDKLKIIVENFVEDKKGKKGEKIEVDWNSVIHVGRDVRDGRITTSNDLISALKKVRPLKEVLSDREFRALGDEAEELFTKEK